MTTQENWKTYTAETKLCVVVLFMATFSGCVGNTNPIIITDANPNKLEILLFPKQSQITDTNGNSHDVHRAMVVSFREALSETVEMYIDDTNPTAFPRSEFCCAVAPALIQSFVDELNRDLRQSTDGETYRSVSFSQLAGANGMAKCELEITTSTGKKILHRYRLQDDEIVLPGQ